jgi:PDZ domain-containing protein
MTRVITPLRLALAGLALLVVAAVILWLTPSSKYILLPDKARSVAPLVSVPASRAHTPSEPGKIYFLAVVVRKATLMEQLFPWLRDGATIVGRIAPPGVSEQAQHRIDVRDMSQSQTVAAVVALRALGYKGVERSVGARIVAVVPKMPAAGRLTPGDVVTAVDGKPVRSMEALRRFMRRLEPGNVVRFTVRKHGGRRVVRLRTVSDPHRRGRAFVGVLLDDAARIKLPFPVRVDAGSVVGPSAGLAFALEIMQKLGRNVVHGLSVAATGELELNGEVLPIGGVEQKAIEAKRAHVDILLVPAGENAAEARRYAGDVRVTPVKTFQQALHALATAARGA